MHRANNYPAGGVTQLLIASDSTAAFQEAHVSGFHYLVIIWSVSKRGLLHYNDPHGNSHFFFNFLSLSSIHHPFHQPPTSSIFPSSPSAVVTFTSAARCARWSSRRTLSSAASSSTSRATGRCAPSAPSSSRSTVSSSSSSGTSSRTLTATSSTLSKSNEGEGVPAYCMGKYVSLLVDFDSGLVDLSC